MRPVATVICRDRLACDKLWVYLLTRYWAVHMIWTVVDYTDVSDTDVNRTRYYACRNSYYAGDLSDRRDQSNT